MFFSDAVIAIAITLLALDLRVDHTAGERLQFSDIFEHWKTFAAFFLSFFNIATFWKSHHLVFAYIRKIDDRIIWFHIAWLLFIVLLPFSTTLVSAHFFDTPAIFTYALNMLMIAIFQNMIWDYPAMKPGFLRDELIDAQFSKRIRLFYNFHQSTLHQRSQRGARNFQRLQRIHRCPPSGSCQSVDKCLLVGVELAFRSFQNRNLHRASRVACVR